MRSSEKKKTSNKRDKRSGIYRSKTKFEERPCYEFETPKYERSY